MTIDSFMSAAPSTISPSAGTLPPGRTITTSPTRSSDGATVTDSPPSTRSASSGSSAASESSAERGLGQRPHLDPVAEQHDDDEQRQLPPEVELVVAARPRLAPHDEMNATVMARPISSIIPGLRERISLIAPVKNGRPPQKYITVPSTGDTHRAPGKSGIGVAEDHREHAGQRDRRYRENQHDPEQPAELGDVVVMTTMARVAVSLVVCVTRGWRLVDLGHAHTIPHGGIREVGSSRSR